MRTNKKREQFRLGEIWPNFLRDFITKLEKSFKGKYTLKRNDDYNGEVHIDFKFDHMLCSDIYRAIANILRHYNTTGILLKVAEKIAEVSNLAIRFGKCNDIHTRGRSIYRSINRYKPIAA